MKRTYSEELGEWIREKKLPVPRHRNLAAFLAIRNDVQAALDDGWAIKTIWAHMSEHKRVQVSYNTFTIYVKRHLHQRPSSKIGVLPHKVQADRTETTTNAVRTQAAPTTVSAAGDASKLPGFSYNPVANLDELF